MYHINSCKIDDFLTVLRQSSFETVCARVVNASVFLFFEVLPTSVITICGFSRGGVRYDGISSIRNCEFLFLLKIAIDIKHSSGHDAAHDVTT
jgi:hypothetical protein